MTPHDLDNALAQWFEKEALVPPAAGSLDRVVNATRRRTPRPGWLARVGSQWVTDTPVGVFVADARSRVKPSAALILLVALLALLLGGAVIVGSRLHLTVAPQVKRLGYLAYAVDGDIVVADWDGRNPRSIAVGPAGGTSGCGSAGYWAEGPMWSPDGTLLAYRSPRSQVDCDRPGADTYPKVMLSDPNGTLVASFPGVGWLIPWSPDSTRVATWLDLYPATRIGVYGTDGVQQATISLPPSIYGTMDGDFDPTWSSDGESLLIRVGGDTWEVPIDGQPPQLLHADAALGDPRSSRSPDGSRVAYVADGELVVAAADGSEPRVLLTGVIDGTSTPWSSSGDRIAFTAGMANESGEVQWSELRVIDLASDRVTTLVPADDGDLLWATEFSPEGDRILFGRTDRVWQQLSTWSVNASDGSDMRQLVSGTHDADWQSVLAAPAR